MFIVVKLIIENNESDILYVNPLSDEEGFKEAYQHMLDDIDTVKTDTDYNDVSVSYVNKNRTELFERMPHYLYTGAKYLSVVYEIIRYDDFEE